MLRNIKGELWQTANKHDIFVKNSSEAGGAGVGSKFWIDLHPGRLRLWVSFVFSLDMIIRAYWLAIFYICRVHGPCLNLCRRPSFHFQKLLVYSPNFFKKQLAGWSVFPYTVIIWYTARIQFLKEILQIAHVNVCEDAIFHG